MKLSEIPVIVQDPYGPEVMDDPYPFYEELREAGPIVYLEKYDAVATGQYDPAREVLINWKSFTSARGVGLADLQDKKTWGGVKQSALVEQDPPVHTGARTAIMKVLAPRVLRKYRSAMQARAEELVNELVEKKEFDAFGDFAHDYVFSIVPDLIGVPAEGRENMLPFSTLSIQASTSPHNETVRRMLADAAHLREWVEHASRREALAPDSMGSAIWGLVDSGEITEDLAERLIRALITAGLDNTMYAITNTIHSMLQFPEQWGALRNNPSLAKYALDETLRFQSPTQTITRTTSAAVDFYGVDIPEGTKFIVFNAATGRDKRKWGDDAENYRLNRASQGHLGLGFGIHQCAGQVLARMESEILLSTLAKRVTTISANGPMTPLKTPPLRSWTELPVTVT